MTAKETINQIKHSVKEPKASFSATTALLIVGLLSIDRLTNIATAQHDDKQKTSISQSREFIDIPPSRDTKKSKKKMRTPPPRITPPVPKPEKPKEITPPPIETCPPDPTEAIPDFYNTFGDQILPEIPLNERFIKPDGYFDTQGWAIVNQPITTLTIEKCTMLVMQGSGVDITIGKYHFLLPLEPDGKSTNLILVKGVPHGEQWNKSEYKTVTIKIRNQADIGHTAYALINSHTVGDHFVAHHLAKDRTELGLDRAWMTLIDVEKMFEGKSQQEFYQETLITLPQQLPQ